MDATGLVLRWTLDCSEDGLAGRRISIVGLESVESSVLVRAVLAGGSSASWRRIGACSEAPGC